MRKTLDIARHELRLIFIDRSIWVNLVVVPILISFAVGLATGVFMDTGIGTADATLLVDVFNSDTGPEGAALLTRVAAINDDIVLCPQENDADDRCQLGDQTLTTELAQDRLIEQTSLAMIRIPGSFSDDLENGDEARLVYRSNNNTVAPSYILQALQAAVQQIGGAQAAAIVGMDVANGLDFLRFRSVVDRKAFSASIHDSAAAAWENPPARVDTVISQSAGAVLSGGGFNQSIPGIASMYVMMIVFPAAAVLIRERKQGTFQRLLSMPVRRGELLGGKLSGRFVVGMIEYAIIFAFGALLGVRYGGAPVALLLLMASFVLCITALTLLLTTFLKNEQQAQSVALFLALTLAPLGGAWWPLSIVPEWMRTIGHLSPVAWVMDGFNALIYTAAGFEAVVVPIAVLLGMTALFFGLGVARFRFE
ncbi:MAG: ABC transporter permease [Anaerolineae bacterium]|nr:ABC transporter permease [Anaerolineae bacterium]